MKAVFALTAILLISTGSQGFLLDSLKDTFHSIGDAFTDTFKQVGSQAKVVGQGLLDQLKTQGSQLAGQALQSLLLGGMQALHSATTEAPAVKRDLANIAQSLDKFIGAKIEEHKTLLETTVDGLTSVGALIPHDSKLSTVISTVDNLVHAHNIESNKITTELVEGIVAHYASALAGHKRGLLTDVLGGVKSTLFSLLQPSVESSKNLIAGLAQTVKQTAAMTVANVQPHVDAITTSTLAVLQHGGQVVTELKGAVTDVLQQTLSSVQPHLLNIAQHATQTLLQSGPQFLSNLRSSVASTLAQQSLV